MLKKDTASIKCVFKYLKGNLVTAARISADAALVGQTVTDCQTNGLSNSARHVDGAGGRRLVLMTVAWEIDRPDSPEFPGVMAVIQRRANPVRVFRMMLPNSRG